MSGNIAIKVHNLGKRYSIGEQEKNRTLREAITGAISSPSKWISKKSKDNYFWALKNVSFNVEIGEVVGIIGRNGAGKSTLLKILSRITTPTEGSIELHGRIGSLLEVGTGFHQELTGRENIYLSGAILGMKKLEIDEKFDDIVKFSEIEQFLDTPVKRYSSGMYVRLAFAVAAHLDPEILMIDEVLAVGDVAFQKKCLRKMRDVTSEGRTILFVSHNMNAIENLCDSCIILDKGNLRDYDKDVRKMVNNYIFGNQNDINPSSWMNDGKGFENPWFKPLRFYIGDEFGNRLVMPVSNDSDMWIFIEGEIDEVDISLCLGYALYNENGLLLYWSYHTDVVETDWVKLERGINRLSSKIPKRFLNEGTYRVELIASLHCRQWICEPSVSAPNIFLTIQGGISESPYATQKPGILAPIMDWRLNN